MLKRAGWIRALKAAVCGLSVWPAVDLWRVLERMNPEWRTAFDYRVFALGILVTGSWAFIFLFLTLACSPVGRLLRMRWPGELRRILGLFAFFYTLLHLVFYVVVGQKLRLDYVLGDAWLQKSRLPGYAALLLLIPLAVTSTDGMLRRLGGKRWKRLHWLVFPAVALAIWHIYGTEADTGIRDFHRTQYALTTFAVLILARLWPTLRKLATTLFSPDH